MNECDRLDEEFDQTLSYMKHHVLKLPLKTDRQTCALWIKKLCDPPIPPLNGRKIRNSYTKLMLKILQKGKLTGPFHHKPPSTCLEPLSAAVIKEYNLESSIPHEVYSLPSWIASDLMDTSQNSLSSSLVTKSPNRMSFNTKQVSTSSHNVMPIKSHETTESHLDFREKLGLPLKRRSHTSLGIPQSSSPHNHDSSELHDSFNMSHLSTDDIEVGTKKGGKQKLQFSPTRHHSKPDRSVDYSQRWRTRARQDVTVANTSTLTDAGSLISDFTRTSSVPASAHNDFRVKLTEAKYEEERLTLQQKHDNEIQKLLNRKNGEIDELKEHYDKKVADAEMLAMSLQKKLQDNEVSHDAICSDKDNRYTNLKSQYELSETSVKKQLEHKLQETRTTMEQEKYELERLHRQNIEDIVQDTNSRLHKMEEQYAQQMHSTTLLMTELEQKVHQLTSEAALTATAKVSLEQKCQELAGEASSLSHQLTDITQRHMALTTDNETLKRLYDVEMSQLKQHTQNTVDKLRTDSMSQLSTANDRIAGQAATIESLRSSLSEREQESLQHRKVNSLKSHLEMKVKELEATNKKLFQQVKEKESEVLSLHEEKVQITRQADTTLAEFKLQVEKNQTRIYEDMKLNMDKIEADLNKSREIREKQLKEFTKQKTEERQNHDKQLSELKQGLNSDRLKLIENHQTEKDAIKKKYEHNQKALQATHKQEVEQLIQKATEKQERQVKIIQRLEGHVTSLKDELLSSNQMRKQQIMELGLAKEAEHQQIIRGHETQLNKIQHAMEQQTLALQKSHSLAIDNQLQQTKSQLVLMETEYSDKLQKSTDTIQRLQFSLQDLNDQITKQKEVNAKNLTNIQTKFTEDRKQSQKKYTSAIKGLKHELERQNHSVKSLENKLQQQYAEQAELETKLKLESENKLNGFLRASVQQEYEDTIISLKSQVHTLQQTVSLLRDGVDANSDAIKDHDSSTIPVPDEQPILTYV